MNIGIACSGSAFKTHWSDSLATDPTVIRKGCNFEGPDNNTTPPIGNVGEALLMHAIVLFELTLTCIDWTNTTGTVPLFKLDKVSLDSQQCLLHFVVFELCLNSLLRAKTGRHFKVTT